MAVSTSFFDHIPGVLDEIGALVVIHGSDGKIVHWNQACSELLGYSLDEVRGRRLWDFMLPRQDVARVARPFERLRATGAPGACESGRCECWCVTRSGERRFITWSSRAALSQDGALEYVIGTGLDRTEAKQIEDAMRCVADTSRLLSSSLDFEETLTRVADTAVSVIADGCVVDLIAADRIRRLKVAHVDPSKVEACAKLHRIELDRSRPHLVAEVLRTRRPLLVSEVDDAYLESLAQGPEHLAILRELGIASLMVLPLLARGRLLGALALVSSYAERRYQKDDLWVAEELAHRAAVALDNAQLYLSAQQAISVRDDVLRVVAHDLRNPLNAARLAASSMVHGLRAANGEARERAVRKAADTIDRSILRADRLIEDLLEVARIEAGRLAIEPEGVGSAGLIADVRDTFEPMVSAAELRFECDVPLRLPDVLGDRERLLQLFSNLIGNAIKFTPGGGRIRVGARAAIATVCFWVEDTGPGVAPSELPHLFDRFWQARPGDRRGAGLGLAIAKGIVEAHGGRIWVESVPFEGSAFFFTIPMAPAPERRWEDVAGAFR